jgi:hypothetical protein
MIIHSIYNKYYIYNIYNIYIIYITYIILLYILKYTKHLLKSLVPSLGFMGDSSPAAPTRQVVSEIRLVQLSESFVSQVPGGGAKLMWRGGPVILMLDCGKDPTMVYNGIYIYICLYNFIICYTCESELVFRNVCFTSAEVVSWFRRCCWHAVGI